MSFRINTEINSLRSLTSLDQSTSSLTSTLERLSSGLRINKAADDASGMFIADSLRTQANSLGQAIMNTNDAIGIAQIADKAIDEQTKIMDTVKQKLIQSAQDGQTPQSRQSLQSDINRLLESFQNIATTTSYNGQPLLSGAYTNKKFQVGAYSDQTANLSILPTSLDKVGTTSFKQSKLLPSDQNDPFGEVALKINDVQLQSVPIGYKNGEGLGVLADVINANSNATGVRASYVVEHKFTEPNQPLIGGKTPSDFTINDVLIGEVTFDDNDRTGSLVTAINSHTLDTGVEASIDPIGGLVLTSPDGRAIKMDTKNPASLNSLRIAYYPTSFNSQLNPTSTPDLRTIDDDGGSSSDNITTVSSPLFYIAPPNSVLSDQIASVKVILSHSNGSQTTLPATYDSTTGTISPNAPLPIGTYDFSYQFIDKNGYGSTLSPSISLTIGTPTIESPVGGNIVYDDSIPGYSVGTINLSGVTKPIATNVPTSVNKLQFTFSGFGAPNEFLHVYRASDYQNAKNSTGLTNPTTDAHFLTLSNWLSSNASPIVNFLGDGSYNNANANDGLSIKFVDPSYVNSYDVDTFVSSGSGTVTLDLKPLSEPIFIEARGAVLSLVAGTLHTSNSASMVDPIPSPLPVDSYFDYSGLVTVGKLKFVENATGSEIDVGGIGVKYIGMSKNDNPDRWMSNLFNVNAIHQKTFIDKVLRFEIQESLSICDSALKQLDAIRADIGSFQKGLEATQASISVSRVMTISSESQIRDADFAKESAEFSKHNLLTQAGNFALAQSNADLKRIEQLLQ